MTPSHEEAADYALFGKIVLSWGRVEMALVNIVLRLMHPLFDLPDHNGVPIFLSQKIALAKRGYRDIPAMGPLRDEARATLAELWPISEKRDIIVHGHYQGFTGSNEYMFGFYEARRGRRRSYKFHYFSRKELADLSDRIEASRRRLQELSAKTFRVDLPEKDLVNEHHHGRRRRLATLCPVSNQIARHPHHFFCQSIGKRQCVNRSVPLIGH